VPKLLSATDYENSPTGVNVLDARADDLVLYHPFAQFGMVGDALSGRRLGRREGIKRRENECRNDLETPHTALPFRLMVRLSR